MKIVKFLEESRFLIQGIGETIDNKQNKKKKEGLLSMLLRTLASLLGSAFAGKGVIKAGEDEIRAGENF